MKLVIEDPRDPDGTALLAGMVMRLGIASDPSEAAAAMLGVWFGLKLAVTASEEQIGRLLRACEGGGRRWSPEERATLIDHVKLLAELADHLGPHGPHGPHTEVGL